MPFWCTRTQNTEYTQTHTSRLYNFRLYDFRGAQQDNAISIKCQKQISFYIAFFFGEIHYESYANTHAYKQTNTILFSTVPFYDRLSRSARTIQCSHNSIVVSCRLFSITVYLNTPTHDQCKRKLAHKRVRGRVKRRMSEL